MVDQTPPPPPPPPPSAPAPLPANAGLYHQPPPSPGQQTANPRKKKLLAIGAGVGIAVVAAIGLESAGVNIIPGADLSASNVFSSKPSGPAPVASLFELQGGQPAFIVGASTHLQDVFADPYSPYLLVHTVMEIRGTQLVEVARPAELPTEAEIISLRHGIAVGRVPDDPDAWMDNEPQSNEFYRWDVAAGSVQKLPVSSDIAALSVVTPDLFFAQYQADLEEPATVSALTTNGEEVWSDQHDGPVALSTFYNVSLTPSSLSDVITVPTPEGDYSLLIDPHTGNSAETMGVYGKYDEGVIYLDYRSGDVVVMDPSLTETLNSFTISPEALRYYQRNRLENYFDFNTAQRALENVEAANLYDAIVLDANGEISDITAGDLEFSNEYDTPIGTLECSAMLVVGSDLDLLCGNSGYFAGFSTDDSNSAMMPDDDSPLEKARYSRWGTLPAWEERGGVGFMRVMRLNDAHYLLSASGRLYLLR